MEGDRDPLDFMVAEVLHMSLAEVEDMDNAERVAWAAWFHVRAELRKLDADG